MPIDGDQEVKKSGRCPKCDSQDIFRDPGWTASYQSGNYVILERGLFVWSKAKMARYVCTHCGFCEEWVDEETELEKIKQQYEKAATSS